MRPHRPPEPRPPMRGPRPATARIRNRPIFRGAERVSDTEHTRGTRRGGPAVHRRLSSRRRWRRSSNEPRPCWPKFPEWIWNGEELPVPVENIADSHFGLLVRDVEDMSSAPGAPELARDSRSPASCSPARRDLGQRRRGAPMARRAGASRSATSSATGSCTAPGPADRCSAATPGRRGGGERRAHRASEIEHEANAFAAALHHAGPPDPRTIRAPASRDDCHAPVPALQLVRSGDGTPTARGDLILQAANDPPMRAVRGEAGLEAPVHESGPQV